MKTLSLVVLSILLLSAIWIENEPEKVNNPTEKVEVLPPTPPGPSPETDLAETITSAALGQRYLKETIETHFLEHQLKERQYEQQVVQTENKALETYLDISWLTNRWKQAMTKKK
ncbi:MAG: hypothetical protein AAF598_13415 [Bacteroidota bacterium]